MTPKKLIALRKNAAKARVALAAKHANALSANQPVAHPVVSYPPKPA